MEFFFQGQGVLFPHFPEPGQGAGVVGVGFFQDVRFEVVFQLLDFLVCGFQEGGIGFQGSGCVCIAEGEVVCKFAKGMGDAKV